MVVPPICGKALNGRCLLMFIRLSRRMANQLVKTSSKVVALAASVALGAGSLVAGALPASAAVGDITSIDVGAGSQPNDIVVGPDGNLWTANRFSNSVSRVTPDGQITSFVVPGDEPNAIVAGPDGALWFTYFRTDAIGRIATDGTTQNFPTGATNGFATDITTGPDGALWYTLQGTQSIGRMTTSGSTSSFAGAGAARSITPGPDGSNRLYYASGADGMGEVYVDGNVNPLTAPQGATFIGTIQNIGGSIWFGMTNAQNQSTLTRLANGSFVEVSTPQITSINQISPAGNDTMFVTDRTGSRIVHVTNSGSVAATYAAGAEPNAATRGPDGNVWVAAGAFNSPGQVRRILSGVVPVSTAAPTVSPTTGLVAGSVMTSTNGSWNYLPTSYSYQWQNCTSDDATTCADIAGATGSSYTVAATDAGKYVRVSVRASNLNGPSDPAYSGLAATGAAPPPNPNPDPQPAAGDTAVIGNGVTMTLDAPTVQKRGKRKWYEVDFSASDVQGAVVFEFAKGKRTKTKTVTIEDGIAEYRWKTPKKWRKGRTTVTATFIPAAGSPYTAAEVTDRVRIR